MKKVPCEVFCRVVGYYRPISNWNEGKKAEFHDRVTFSTSNSAETPTPCAEDLIEAEV